MNIEKLTFPQQQALQKLNEAIDEGLRRGLIIFQGPFQSGKTRIALEILRQRGLPASVHYLNLNQFLLAELVQQMKANPDFKYNILSRLKAKTARIFELAIQRFLAQFFQKAHFLVIDAVELLCNYPINLPQLAYDFCRDTNIIIILVPHDLKTGFEFNWTYQSAKLIALE